MDLQLKGKSAFISGSTSGIGFGVAKILLQEGAGIVINGRSRESVSKAVQGLKVMYPKGNIKGMACDFSKPTEVDTLCTTLTNIDILINNVGIYSSQDYYETTDQQWADQIEVNIMSGVRLSRALLPNMIKNNWGRIIFVSSECASLVPADLIAYSTTKTALLGVSRGLAQLTKGTSVTVNTVLPGSTMTEGAEVFIKNLASKQKKTIAQTESDFFKEVRTSSLLQRFARVEEVANTIVYFSSPLAAATNGAAIKLDGGSMCGII